jgi:hypothetical protein
MNMDKSKQASNDSHRIATSDDIEVSTYLEIAKELGDDPGGFEPRYLLTASQAFSQLNYSPMFSSYNLAQNRAVSNSQVLHVPLVGGII